MLDKILQFLGKKAKIIVEQGKIDNFWYTKYSDGTIELHGFYVQNVNFHVTSGINFGGANSDVITISMPDGLFKTVYSGTVSARTSWDTEVRYSVFNPGAITVKVASNSTGTRSCTFNINMWGTWE